MLRLLLILAVTGGLANGSWDRACREEALEWQNWDRYHETSTWDRYFPDEIRDGYRQASCEACRRKTAWLRVCRMLSAR